MLSSEQNQLLTRIGPETAMGELMRRYWIPALLGSALPEPDGDPVRVRLMGEPLVAFRDSLGRVGLLDERCPHRTVSLFFGRNEACGLRCVYHGWKFDVAGDCVDMPSEPAGSPMRERIKAKAYPCVEHGGVVWAYMGPPEHQPQFPNLEWASLPASHVLVTRQLLECNWLQGFEGGFDASHLSFLHQGDLLVEYGMPARTECVQTGSGLIFAYGREEHGDMVWTSDTMLMPFHKLISIPTLPQAMAWVPVDDQLTMQYCVTYSPSRPLTDEERIAYSSGDRIHALTDPLTTRTLQNRDNDYLIDRDRQRSGASFSGIKGVGMQDSAIQESMGRIADRSLEHLGTSDFAIIRLRRYLTAALEDCKAGREVPGHDSEAFDLRPLYLAVSPELSVSEVLEKQRELATANAGAP